MTRLQAASLQQPLLLQRGERRTLDLLLLERGGGLRPLAQQGEGLLLLGGALELVEIDRHPGVGGKPELQLPVGGGLALAHQHRQGVGQHLAQRMLVVVGTPLHQRQYVRAQHRGAVQHPFDGFELGAGHLTLARMGHHQADQGLGAEGDLDPTTGRRQGQGGEIVEMTA
ncbi:hypothetical protein D3C85_978070 [compost metagenome]